MNLKNLGVQKITHKKILEHLNNKEISKRREGSYKFIKTWCINGSDRRKRTGL